MGPPGTFLRPLPCGEPPHYVFARAPLLIYWEATCACDLACRHCRAEVVAVRHPGELSTEEGRAMLREARRFGDPPPHLVITGGDPLKRPDLWDLIAAAVEQGFGVSLAPSGTGLLTQEVIRRLAASGIQSLSLSLDGSTAGRHDAFRGVPGRFEVTLQAARWVRAVGIPLQINTLLDLARDAPFAIKTTEVPHDRRVAVVRMRAAGMDDAVIARTPVGRGFGVRDGNGIMFVSHTGEVYPSGFLPLGAGNVRTSSIVELYRASPLFVRLRDVDRLTGKCGACPFKAICGGSRARAYAWSGDEMGSDPLCPYQP